PEEIIGETPFDLMPPAEANRVSKIFNAIIASQQPFDCLENINLHKDGHPVVLETSGVPTFDADGAFRGYRGIDRDITKRKRAEESLRKKTHDLDERVKELNCLYGISKIRERPDIAFEEMLQEIVDLIPSSWQHPEITCARILIGGQEYKTENFKETVWKQTSKIVVHGKRIGILEICYIEEKPEGDEGPFQKEERNLISAITERLGRVTEHKQVEGALRKAHDELERRVKERTRELEVQKNGLKEINTAMTVLLKKREEDKTELEDNVLTNVKELVEPYFEKIKKTKLDDHQEAFLSIIESNLKEIISPFTRKMSMKYLNLTPTEIRIANLIRHGSSSKKIAELQNVSPRTIDTHRKNIREQLTPTEKIYEERLAYRVREEISGLTFYPSIEWVFYIRILIYIIQH
ncbi:MAG: PAS domain S-box protein, partial [Deltaproteobacteria bacterium]|nr:PAS domain S-box protein [Deltaproteobacteria bacterium]